MSESPWQASAACRGLTDEHYPTKPGRKGQELAERARRRCLGCPVLEVCLAQTLVDERRAGPDYRFGVAGGMTGPERAELEDRLGASTLGANLARVLEWWDAGRLTPPPWPPPPLAGWRTSACEWCGATIRQAANTSGPRRRYCSKRCGNAAWEAQNRAHRAHLKRVRYHADPEPIRQANRARYHANPEPRRAAQRDRDRARSGISRQELHHGQGHQDPTAHPQSPDRGHAV